jgi:peroxin-16
MSDIPYNLIERYRVWAASNPSIIQDVEIFLRGFSYFLTGYIKESVVLSEFVYSLAQLVSVLHTRIVIRNSPVGSTLVSLLEDFLRVVKCVEVFLEIAALRLGGPATRWMLLISLQTLKAILKLIILKKSGKILQPFDQERRRQSISQTYKNDYYSLPCSGRRIRTVQAAPAVYNRTWEPPGAVKTRPLLEPGQYLGEVMYLLKPVIHLAAVGKFGEQAWTPFILAITLDFTSQGLLGSKGESQEHKEEVLRRWFAMANYCLRSPFYDQKSKFVILRVLRCIESCLPLGGGIVGSFTEYLPEYQKIYHYIWAQD